MDIQDLNIRPMNIPNHQPQEMRTQLACLMHDIAVTSDTQAIFLFGSTYEVEVYTFAIIRARNYYSHRQGSHDASSSLPVARHGVVFAVSKSGLNGSFKYRI